MTPETVVVTLYFLFPGLVALAVFDWVFVGRERRGVELVSWAVGVSILAAVPLVAVPQTRELVSYLWDPAGLTAENLFGVGLHVVTGVMVALAAAWVVTRWFDGRIGPKSFYQRSGDWLWGRFGDQPRYLLVKTRSQLYFGQLAFAEDPSKGSDLVLSDPGVWDDDVEDFYRSGMKYALVPGSEIERVELSVSDPPVDSDYPYYEAGFVEDTTPTHKEGGSG